MHGDYRKIRAIAVPATGAPSTREIITAPHRLCGWSLADAGNPPVTESFRAIIAAAAAGTLTLTGFLTVSLVRVVPAAAWPAGANLVSLTNMIVGEQDVYIEGGTANEARLEFPGGLATAGTPVVGVPAIVGGPAYTIEAVGTVQGALPIQSPAFGQFYDGGQLIGVSAPPLGTSDTQWLSDEGIYVGTSTSLLVVIGTLTGCIYIRESHDYD